MIAILTLIFVVAISMLATKTGTIALMHTGMSRDRAQFQARSAFSGAGFTTSESEVVVRHPVRRRVIMNLIVWGNAGVVTAIATLIIGFAGQENSSIYSKIGLLALGGIVLLFVTKSKRMDRMMEKIITRSLEKYGNISPRSFARIVTVMDDHEVTEMEVGDIEWLKGSRLSDLKLPSEGVLVLGVVREDESFIGVPPGSYVIESTDRLIVYGKTEQVAALAKRDDKLRGKAAHRESVEKHREEMDEVEKSIQEEQGKNS